MELNVVSLLVSCNHRWLINLLTSYLINDNLGIWKGKNSYNYQINISSYYLILNT